jgi:hypothetical protein
MKLTCYITADRRVSIEPAPSKRPWMDQTRRQSAYRCLPLSTANAHGWQILCQDACKVRWNGGEDENDLTVITESGSDTYVSSHFGYGILTFKLYCILRTEPDTNLWITGPVNQFKDGIQAMSALIEADWMPYTFTMNWQITRPNHWIEFKVGEPICHFFPVQRGIVDSVKPSFASLKGEPTIYAHYSEWHQERQAFLEEYEENREVALKKKSKMEYYRGMLPDGARAIPNHQTKIQPRKFGRKDRTENS